MTEPDPVRVSTRVDTDCATAFDVFAEEIGTWWRRGTGIPLDPADGVPRFVGGAGGRVVLVQGDGSETELGRILAFERGRRLAFEWFLPGSAAAARTEVVVTFEPAGKGTRVTVEHHGLSTLPADHPARRGLKGTALASLVGLRWADRLVALARRAARHPPPGDAGAPEAGAQ